MSQQTVYVVMRGEDNEGGSVEMVFATHKRAVKWVLDAMVESRFVPHAGKWEITEHMKAKCSECGTAGEHLPSRWECGIDWIEIEAWPVNP